MSIWSTIASNPGLYIDIGIGLLGLLGFDRWRKKVKQTTAHQIDQWASTAAGAIVLAVRVGVFEGDAAKMLNAALHHVRELARAVGVKLTPANEHQALAVINKILIAAGVDMAPQLPEQALQIGKLVQESVERMSRLPWKAAGGS